MQGPTRTFTTCLKQQILTLSFLARPFRIYIYIYCMYVSRNIRWTVEYTYYTLENWIQCSVVASPSGKSFKYSFLILGKGGMHLINDTNVLQFLEIILYLLVQPLLSPHSRFTVYRKCILIQTNSILIISFQSVRPTGTTMHLYHSALDPEVVLVRNSKHFSYYFFN